MPRRIAAFTLLIALAAGSGALAAIVAAWGVSQKTARETATRTTETFLQARSQAIQAQTQSLQDLRSQTEILQGQLSNPGLPVGALMPYAGPLNGEGENRLFEQGWLPADGRTLARDDFPLLFRVIGEYYGQAENLSKFRLPDLRGRTAIGVGSYDDPVSGRLTRILGQSLGAAEHVLSQDELPVHTHGIKVQKARGSLEGEYPVHRYAGTGTSETRSERAGGNVPHNNMPPALAVHYIIRFR